MYGKTDRVIAFGNCDRFHHSKGFMMNQSPYLSYGGYQPQQAVQTGTRADFIVRTYVHLLAAVGLLVFLEYCYFASGMAETIGMLLMGSMINWIIALGLFMVVGMAASSIAGRSRDMGMQYAALAGYVIVQSLILCPLLWIASMSTPHVIAPAAVTTLVGFTVLSAIVFLTRKNFSWMRSMLMWGSFCAIGIIIAALIFGFTLGPIFAVAMIALAGGFILYETSNVLHDYEEDRHVAASLALFASLATLFWWVLRLYMMMQSDD